MKSTITLIREANEKMEALNASVKDVNKSFQETQKYIQDILLEAKTILQK